MPPTFGSSCASTTILWSGPINLNTVSTSPIGSAQARQTSASGRSATSFFMGSDPHGRSSEDVFGDADREFLKAPPEHGIDLAMHVVEPCADADLRPCQ